MCYSVHICLAVSFCSNHTYMLYLYIFLSGGNEFRGEEGEIGQPGPAGKQGERGKTVFSTAFKLNLSISSSLNIITIHHHHQSTL